jgi:hypothetical protein
MKKFITINGKKATIAQRPSLSKAIESAENICDHSKEIIVREIQSITDHTKEIEESPVLKMIAKFINSHGTIVCTVADGIYTKEDARRAYSSMEYKIQQQIVFGHVVAVCGRRQLVTQRFSKPFLQRSGKTEDAKSAIAAFGRKSAANKALIDEYHKEALKKPSSIPK